MNSDNRIGLVSVADLAGKRFVIPQYQRGYRWEKQQVTDLLKDLYAFMKGGGTGYYCLQPLAVKKITPDMDKFRDEVKYVLAGDDNSIVDELTILMENSISWEVIDGQQRLTTIFILISLLNQGKVPYGIEYITRPGSRDFLMEIRKKSEDEAKSNIDFFHMWAAFAAADEWFCKQESDGNCNIRTELSDVINNRVKFIWYESVDERPINVFTRLNIGKISLTNSELIKATLLNKSNYPDENGLSFQSLQLSIASKWDEIEYSLQNDEFWLFLNSPSKKETRIDFIFELIHSQDLYSLRNVLNDQYDIVVGNDRYSVFRYFSAATEFYCTEKSVAERLANMWSVVVEIYNTFMEWFNDNIYYHYIGFLLWDYEEKKKNKYVLLNNLCREWKCGDKDAFKESILNSIKGVVNKKAEELDKLHFEKDKPVIKRILLLHNIQTIIENQEIQHDKYELNVFYKFPFHLFKKEVWNVEHIDSATTNELTKPKERKAWICAAAFAIANMKDAEELKKMLYSVSEEESKFEEIYNKVDALFPNETKLKTPEENNADIDNERMYIWNLALLDEGTNKSYHNSIFSVKRSFIIFKELGMHCRLNEDGTVRTDKEKAIAFVPPCTKQVFLKYYTMNPTNLLSWSRNDAKAYLEDIRNKVEKFLKNE